MNILEKITRCRAARHWTEYQLAEKAGLPQSTISSWYRKGISPSYTSMEKICVAFGITLSQLLADESDTTVTLTAQQKEMLDHWSKLDENQKRIMLEFLKTL